MKEKIFLLPLILFLGLFLGAVLGSIVDSILGISFLAKSIHSPLALEFYIIKIEIGLTPASLVGAVVTIYFMLRKG